MSAYIARRILLMIPTLLGVMLLVFVIFGRQIIGGIMEGAVKA